LTTQRKNINLKKRRSMPIKMVHKDDEVNVYLIINKKLLYTILVMEFMIFFVVVFMLWKVHFWFVIRGI
jgi:hypothetical protein